MAKPERKVKAGTITGTECLKTDWQTPEHLLEAVRDYFGGRIPLDAATAPDNPTKAVLFFTGENEAKDGLHNPWRTAAFCNPPYGRVIRLWLEKIVKETRRGTEIVTLLPCARWEQGYFHQALEAANMVCFIRKRVSFVNPATGHAVGGNPYANMFLGFNTSPERFFRAFAPIGLCVKLGQTRREYK